MRWSSGRNKADEYEYSVPGRVSCCKELASLQQAPGRLHVETWAGREGNPSLSISQVVEIMSRCADMVTRLLSSLLCHLDRAEKFGMGWVGH